MNEIFGNQMEEYVTDNLAHASYLFGHHLTPIRKENSGSKHKIVFKGLNASKIAMDYFTSPECKYFSNYETMKVFMYGQKQ